MLSELKPHAAIQRIWGLRPHFFPANYDLHMLKINSTKIRPNKKGTPFYSPGCPYNFNRSYFLSDGYIYCRRALLTIFDVKGDPISFIQRFKTACIDSGMMNKHIRSLFLFYKTIAFTAVKPFYDTISHRNVLLSNDSSNNNTALEIIKPACHLLRLFEPAIKLFGIKRPLKISDSFTLAVASPLGVSKGLFIAYRSAKG